MLSKVMSGSLFGLEMIPIEAEVNLYKKGFPGFSIIGLANKAIDEARERVKTALVNTGISFPQAKIVVNLAPADIPKEGAQFDLPIAIGILHALELISLESAAEAMFYGELSLDGSLRHTKGVFLLALNAREIGIKKLFVPKISAREASVVSGIDIYPVENLTQIIEHLSGVREMSPMSTEGAREVYVNDAPEFDFSEVVGQEQAKRALTIAAAGGHNIFMMGPPGAGKTMLARALAGILPVLTEQESVEVTKIYSVTGNIPPGGSLIRLRPFRTSHHTSSRIGLIGGGSNPKPGEISMAHRGVMFLDEFPEYPRSILEALRQPLEDGVVNITRASGSARFPAQFMLVAAANPCPCGYLGDSTRECKCSPRQIMRYQSKLSGPIMDRIDLHINVPAVDVEKLVNRNSKNVQEGSEKIRKKVEEARNIQQSRFGKNGISSNSDMKNKHVKAFCVLENKALQLLKQAVNSYGLSARTYFRLIKVSQTVADLEGAGGIGANHVAEALQYRIRTGE